MSMSGDYGKGWVERENLTRALPESGVVHRTDVTKEMLLDKTKKPSILIMVLFEDGTVMAARDNDNRKMDSGSFLPTRGSYKTTFGSGRFGLDFEDIFISGGGLDHQLHGAGRFIEENTTFDSNAHVMSGEGWAVCTWVLRCPRALKKYVLNHMNDLSSACESPRFDDFVALPYDKLFDEDWRKFGGETKYDVKNSRKVVGEDGVTYRIWDQQKFDNELGPVMMETLYKK